MNSPSICRTSILLVAFLLGLGLIPPLPAVTVNWTNVTAGGLWETPGNWNPNQAPTIADAVTFTVDGSYNVHVTNSTADSSPANMTIGSMAMGSSAADAPRLVVNFTNASAAFQVTNAGINALTMGATGSKPTLEIQNGDVQVAGYTKVGNGLGGVGTILLKGGSFFSRDLQISSAVGGTGIVVVAGGELLLTNMSTLVTGVASGNNGTYGALIVSNGTVVADSLAASTFIVGRAASGARAEMLVYGGTVDFRTGVSVGQASGATGSVLVAGGTVTATNMTGSSFFALGSASFGSMVISNQGVFAVNQMTVGASATGDGHLLVTDGGRMEMTGLNALYGGHASLSGGLWSISNYNGGTVQFTTNTPTLANRLGTGSDYVINSVIEFKGVNAADLGGNLANFFTFQGTNTLRLIGATNKSVAAYSLQTNGTAFAFLDLAGANSAFQATNLTVGAGAGVVGTGTLLVNSATNLGILAPGHSAGVLAFSSNLTLGSSSILNIEIGGTNSSDFDRLLASGTLILGGTLNVSLINGYVPTGGETFDILDAGLFSGLFATQNLPSAEWSFSESTGVLTFAVIPEPGAAALVALGGLVAFALRRRRAA